MRITNVLIVAAFFLTAPAVLKYERTDPSAFGGAGATKASASPASATQAGPKIKSARLKGKKLILTGENFDDRAVILINHTTQKTRNDWDSPTTTLIAKNAGKKMAPDQIVTIQVQNSNGSLSEGLAFHSGCGSQD